jgi:2',3'-cyclic-nucleotide 2'-phosphodiesterase (5'-nucleotidase family)
MHLLLALLAAIQQLIPTQSLSATDTARIAIVVPTDVQGRDSTLLRVLAINDFHGALEPQVWPWSVGRQVGGVAALKPWLDSLARVCSCTSIRLDARDEMQGTPVSKFNYGRPAIAALNALSIDAAAIGNHEYGLGRLIADAELNIAKTDVALINNGGIRADVDAGLATFGDLFRVEPFQNRLLRLVVSGKVLKAVLEHALAGDRPDAHVAGIEVWYDPRQPAGRRINKLRLADGKGVDGDRSYTLAVSDFVAAGGSGYSMLRGLPFGDVGVTDLDALIQYIAVLRPPIAPPDDARLHREGDGR